MTAGKPDSTKAGGPAANSDFEPSNLLAALKAKALEPVPDGLPARLPVSAITVMPGLFQPRGMDERHIQELVRAIRNNGDLEPIMVLQAGRETCLVDGHHRIAAYQIAAVTDPVPVSYFKGTVEDAVLEAGRANSNAKLPMTTVDRAGFAWRLTLMGTYSKKQTQEAAGVSDGQVGIMRRVMKLLGEDAFLYPKWRVAQRTARGLSALTMTDDERDQWLETQAGEYADRLSKTFGNKLSSNIELAAMALELYFGRRMPELAMALMQHLPDSVDDGEPPDF